VNAQTAYEHTRHLVETFGPRPAGTASMRKAGLYIADCLRRIGAEVEIHRFTVPVTALRSASLTARIGGQAPVDLRHTPVWFAGGTGSQGVDAPVVYGGDGSRRYLDEARPQGKALVLSRDAYLYYPDDHLVGKLNEYDPACVLFTCANIQAGGPPEVYYNYITTQAHPAPPSTVISLEDAEKLVLSDGASVRYVAEYEKGESTCLNVVGTLRGSDPSLGSVLISTHADTTVTSPGAADDAGGFGVALALAEQYAQAAREGRRPRRTLHIAVWSGHESGLHGSKSFILDHPRLVEDLRMVVAFHVVGGAVGMDGLAITGDRVVSAGVQRILAEKRLDSWLVVAGPAPLDVVNFYHAQIPTVTYGQALSPLVIRNHTPADDMASLRVAAFSAPLEFGRAFLDWSLNVDELPPGYPPEVDQVCRDYATTFGWGLYGLAPAGSAAR